MKILYAPWRSEYASDTGVKKKENISSDKCLFCKLLHDDNDKKNFIIKRFKNTFVMLNRYPYNAGHILVLPNAHASTLDSLSKKERSELMEVINKGIGILSLTLKTEGLNLGLNLGKAAGAGMPSHLHMHLLPRWQGDTNFIATIGMTKVISFDLKKIYKQLKAEFDTLPSKNF